MNSASDFGGDVVTLEQRGVEQVAHRQLVAGLIGDRVAAARGNGCRRDRDHLVERVAALDAPSRTRQPPWRSWSGCRPGVCRRSCAPARTWPYLASAMTYAFAADSPTVSPAACASRAPPGARKRTSAARPVSMTARLPAAHRDRTGRRAWEIGTPIVLAMPGRDSQSSIESRSKTWPGPAGRFA